MSNSVEPSDISSSVSQALPVDSSSLSVAGSLLTLSLFSRREFRRNLEGEQNPLDFFSSLKLVETVNSKNQIRYESGAGGPESKCL